MKTKQLSVFLSHKKATVPAKFYKELIKHEWYLYNAENNPIVYALGGRLNSRRLHKYVGELLFGKKATFRLKTRDYLDCSRKNFEKKINGRWKPLKVDVWVKENSGKIRCYECKNRIKILTLINYTAMRIRGYTFCNRSCSARYISLNRRRRD